jgi:hypothetical protein
MSSSQGIASNKPNVVYAIRDRRIMWSRLSDDLIKEQQSKIILFETEWENLANHYGSGTTSDTAWGFFSKVIDEEHVNEEEFDLKLFGALKNALGDVADQVVFDNGFSLPPNNSHSPSSNRQIGFCRKPGCTLTGLDEDYGDVRNFYMDHVCFVADSTDTHSTGWDWMAVIELKIGNAGPKKFETETYGKIEVVTSKPDLGGDHDAIGQALLYTLDTWYSLARQGIEVKKLPITVLTGRKKGKNKETPECLLCVDAWLHIPEYPGGSFTYTIDSFLPFPSASASQSEKTEIYKGAIAVYLRTLGFGMEHGQSILERNDAQLPISLCCRKLKLGDKVFSTTDAKLIASPIPESLKIDDRFKISQGELFKLTPTSNTAQCSLLQLFGAKKSLFELKSRVFGFAPEDCIIVADHILIKVSCVSVHSTLIPLVECGTTLLSLCFEADKTLKSKIAEVLLAVVRGDNTLVTVMRDLSISTTENGAYGMLSPSKIYKEDRKKLKQLWIGLTKLVDDILLPLARLKIIHSDIRPGWETTYNILCREVEGGEIELQLVDYESLHMDYYHVENSQTISSARHTRNSSGELYMNAKEYLWWLILWTAYNWHQQPHASGTETKPSKLERQLQQLKRPNSPMNSTEVNSADAQMFVSKLFTSEQHSFIAFINKIHEWNEINVIYTNDTFDDTSIKRTLTILGNLFDAPDDN